MRRSLLLSFILLALLLALPSTLALAQEKTLYWERYDVVLTVLPNGDLHVLERQSIAFTSGTFTFGFAVIPLRTTEGITDIQISEPGGRSYARTDYGGEVHTFGAATSSDEVEVRWYFPPASNETRTFNLAYTVKGAVRIYDSGDKLQWMAIDNQRDFPIQAASVQVILPEGASFLDIDSAGVPAAWQQANDGRSVTYVAERSMSPSDTFEIGVEFTHGAIPARPPNWQGDFDQAEYYERNVGPWLNLGLGVLAVLVAIGGPLLVYLLWYVRGRDPEVGPTPEYVTEPPDDTPPGVLGTLVDERVDMQDILATIVDLARRGYLKIEEIEKPGLLGFGSQDFVFRKGDGAGSDLRPYERNILRGIFTGNRTERELSSLRNKFYTKLPKIKSEMYEELVRRDLFKSNPDTTRNLWRGLAIGAAIVVGIGFFFAAPLSEYAGAVMCLPLAFGAAAVSLFVAANYMPAKTRKGAESAARWQAFREYLDRIEKVSDLDQASELFERFLPYAIAFGMNQTWVRKFSTLTDTPAPGWYIPYPRPLYRSGGGPSGGRPLASETPAGTSRPGGGLQEMSDSLSGGLQSMSDGLTQMLNSTSRILRTAPASSGRSGGGGFSGGGFSGGGGGGGGSRGFG